MALEDNVKIVLEDTYKDSECACVKIELIQRLSVNTSRMLGLSLADKWY